MTTSSTRLQQPRPSYARIGARQRAAAAAVAATISMSIGSALLCAFHTVSPTRWLDATPAVLSEVARCESLEVDHRVECKRAYVTAQLDALSRPSIVVARR